MNSSLKHLKKTTKELRQEFRMRTLTYLLAAFGFVTGLAWNDAVTAGIAYFFPADKDSLFAKFLYAVFVTLLVVVVSFYINRLNPAMDDHNGSGKK